MTNLVKCTDNIMNLITALHWNEAIMQLSRLTQPYKDIVVCSSINS